MTPSRTHLTPADRHEMAVDAAIAERGFYATHVLGDQVNTAFSYTTGFLLAGHPELVTLGLAPSDSFFVFEHLMDEVRSGVVRMVGRDAPNEINGGPFRLLPVPVEHYGGGDCLLLGFASYYGPKQFRFRGDGFLQVVWPDPAGRFPWEDGVEATVLRDQPVLADGDPPTRRWPLEHPVDNRSQCSMCCSEPLNRAERRRQARRRR
jgi:hypothetical protein